MTCTFGGLILFRWFGEGGRGVTVVVAVIVPKDHKRCCGSCLPLLRGEDEFPKLQVPQYNGRLVAVGNSRNNLLEEPSGLLFPKPFPASHVGVHVSKVLLKEDVGLALPEDHFHDASNVAMGWQLDVRPDFVLVVFNGKLLWGESDLFKGLESQEEGGLPPRSYMKLGWSSQSLGFQWQ